MTFDPFGDFATQGYLRNHAGQKDIAKVKDLEHDAFRGNVERALHKLSRVQLLSYEDVKKTHETLFGDVYPWAGQDRTQTAPKSAIGKGGNYKLFSHPQDSRRATEMALGMATDQATMRDKPGEVMGLLAYAHPFLDGNGRTIMTVYADLCRRAGMHIDWSQTNKTDYLTALTQELEIPGKGHLDAYLKPYVRSGAIDLAQSAEALRDLPGLGPGEEGKRADILITKRAVETAVSKNEFAAACEASDDFKLIERNLERIAATVYKDPSQVLGDVRLAATTGDREVVKRIKLDPESYGPYNGAGGIFSTLQERRDYRNAIAFRDGLRATADHLITTAASIRQTLESEKQILAERGKVEIRMPDPELMSAIEKKRPLSEAQVADIDRAIRSFEHQFGDEIGRVRSARNVEPLAQKHGLEPEQVLRARQVLKMLDKGQSRAREQVQPVRSTLKQSRRGPSR